MTYGDVVASVRKSASGDRLLGARVHPVPSKIAEAALICYTPIDGRHRHTGNCRQIVAGVLQSQAASLAICQYEGEDGFYLFGCDENWHSFTDTWHETLEDAKRQA